MVRPAEKTLESAYFIFCNSFQNLRLGGINLQEIYAISSFVHPSKTFEL